MNEIKLSKRLQAIYDMVPQSVLADIGADHGKLIISLFENGVITHGYAVENKKGPFDRLYKAIESRGLLNDVIPLFSDGIKDIPDTVSTVVIAGMGCNNIIDILTEGHEKLPQIRTLIIDSHTNVPFIRRKITDMGFVIADEKIVEEDNIYYEIIKFIRSDAAFYNDKEIEFGPILSKEKSDAFKAKYSSRVKEIDMLLSKKLPIAKIQKLEKEKSTIKEIL